MNRPELKALLENLDTWQGFTPDTEGAATAIRNLAAEIDRLRIIVADYHDLQHRSNAIDDENERLRAALIHSRTFLKTYKRSNATWHNDRPTWDFIRTVIDPAIGDADEQSAREED